MRQIGIGILIGIGCEILFHDSLDAAEDPPQNTKATEQWSVCLQKDLLFSEDRIQRKALLIQDDLPLLYQPLARALTGRDGKDFSSQ